MSHLRLQNWFTTNWFLNQNRRCHPATWRLSLLLTQHEITKRILSPSIEPIPISAHLHLSNQRYNHKRDAQSHILSYCLAAITVYKLKHVSVFVDLLVQLNSEFERIDNFVLIKGQPRVFSNPGLLLTTFMISVSIQGQKRPKRLVSIITNWTLH